MKTLVLPVAGKSSRFACTRPKFMLTHPNGKSMLFNAIAGVHPEKFDRILVIGLAEHETEFGFCAGLRAELGCLSGNTDIVLLDNETASQPETIYRGLVQSKVSGGVLIKDCDNCFTLSSLPTNNAVCVVSLNHAGIINAGNKSYVLLGEHQTIANIVEKSVIGNLFCCGGYYFSEAETFCRAYEDIGEHNNLYVSHIIYQLILGGAVFFSQEVGGYSDWGTLDDWTKYCRSFSTIFIDLDGTLLLAGQPLFTPAWKQEKPNTANVAMLNELFDTGRHHVVITTARPETYRDDTVEQLARLGIRHHRLMMGLPHARRVLINDYALTNQYPSAEAINIPRNGLLPGFNS